MAFAGFLDLFDTVNNNGERLPTMLAKSPRYTSWKVYEHQRQIGLARQFQRYNYGFEKNRELYGSLTPPLYDLKNINVPLAMIFSDLDYMSEKETMKWILDKHQSGL